MTHAVILCPMEIERAACARALRRAGHDHARVCRTGVGKDAILRTLCELARGPDRPGAFILAGVCGGLSPCDPVPPIARIIDEHGRAWTGGLGMDPAGVTLIGVDRLIASPADKRALAHATGASVVDMESHAFAHACEHLGVRWGVVRGVSDSPDHLLPEEILGWLNPDGTARPLRALADMARRPSLVPHVLGAIRRSNAVLPVVGRRAGEISRID